jgi:glycine dehydrogenase subunit 1
LEEIGLSYVLNTPDDQRAMLAQIGVDSVQQLFQAIPPELRLKRPLQVPPALTELELTQHLQQLAIRNRSAEDTACFLGGGSYDHFIPAVVDAVAGRSEYYTAYTPYQARPARAACKPFSSTKHCCASSRGWMWPTPACTTAAVPWPRPSSWP